MLGIKTRHLLPAKHLIYNWPIALLFCGTGLSVPWYQEGYVTTFKPCLCDFLSKHLAGHSIIQRDGLHGPLVSRARLMLFLAMLVNSWASICSCSLPHSAIRGMQWGKSYCTAFLCSCWSFCIPITYLTTIELWPFAHMLWKNFHKELWVKGFPSRLKTGSLGEMDLGQTQAGQFSSSYTRSREPSWTFERYECWGLGGRVTVFQEALFSTVSLSFSLANWPLCFPKTHHENQMRALGRAVPPSCHQKTNKKNDSQAQGSHGFQASREKSLVWIFVKVLWGKMP